MPTRLTHNLPATSALPKVAFKVVDLSARKPQGVADRQAESFGFNDGSEWEFPEGYIRWIRELVFYCERLAGPRRNFHMRQVTSTPQRDRSMS